MGVLTYTCQLHSGSGWRRTKSYLLHRFKDRNDIIISLDTHKYFDTTLVLVKFTDKIFQTNEGCT